MQGKIISLIWQAKNTVYVILHLNEPLNRNEGSFIQLTYKGVTRAYTVCNADPNYLELFIKLKKGGQMSSLLESAKVGDSVGVEGPFKESNIEGNDLVFIAGGSGLAAFMTYLRHNELSGSKKIHLFLSSRRLIEVGFLGELLRLRKTKVFITLTREEQEGYSHGRLSRDVIEKNCNLKGKEIWVCGPSVFTKSLEEQLKEYRPHALSW